MMGYYFPVDRKLSAVGYLLVVYALRNEGIFKSLPEFGYHANGKPYLINYPGIQFNLSHSKDVVVCYVSDQEVGIDVEAICEYDDDLAQAICNEKEYQWVQNFSDLCVKARMLTELWTRKESVVKCLGMGLEVDPKDIMDLYPYQAGVTLGITSVYCQEGTYCISICKKIKS